MPHDIRSVVEAEMRRLGWTRYRLAKEAGVSPTIAARIFAGQGVSLANLQRMLDALGLEIRRRK